jgi:large subunit ribosomal protein L1|tara:strand:+ start:482 stop:1270 length:789 start_codon:yes stop_codon:yes gene_type:complete
MNKKIIQETLAKLKKESSKRKFSQTVELVVNLKGLDLKKPEHQVHAYVQLHHSRGKPVKVCALVGPELLEQAKTDVDGYVGVDDFGKHQDKMLAKKLANSYDYFVAQATIMPKLATAFGRVFGPKGKMPNPKAGCVVPPNANLKQLHEKLQKTVKLLALTDPIIHVAIGTEEMADDAVVDNIQVVYDWLVHHLPQGKDNIRNAFIKMSMTKSYSLGGKDEETSKKDKKSKKVEVKEEAPEESAPEESKESTDVVDEVAEEEA